MKTLRFVWITMAQVFYAWAMREIHPLHPDVPHIMERQRYWNDQARRLFA